MHALKRLLMGTVAGLTLLHVGVAPAIADRVIGQNIALTKRGATDRTISVNWRHALETTRWNGIGFYEAYTANVARLSAAFGDEIPSIMLDIAELYLSHMMIVEARSALVDIVPASDKQARRKTALQNAAHVLSGQPFLTSDLGMLGDQNRPDQSLWLALNAIASDDTKTLERELQNAFLALPQQSTAIARAVLPALVEAAIELQVTELAAVIAPMITDISAQSGDPAGHFLIGRNAELQGQTKVALTAYRQAAQGWDRYAARARLAFADLALKDGSPVAILAAKNLLDDGVDSWRGDVYELHTLERHAVIFTKLNDPVRALQSYGKIMARFPTAPEAKNARAAAAHLLEVIYQAGADGHVPIATWVDIHLLVRPFFEHTEGFAEFNEMLADRLSDLGGMLLAETEYRRTLKILNEWDFGRPDEDRTDKINLVTLKMAAALLTAGQLDKALIAVKSADKDASRAWRDKILMVEAEIYAAQGNFDDLLQTYVSTPKAHHLRDIGQALFLSGRFEDSVSFYERLHADYPQDFAARDASYLIVAAHRTGRNDIVSQIAETFPDLTTSGAWSAMAQSIGGTAPALFPMREDAADQQLSRIAETMKVLDQSGL